MTAKLRAGTSIVTHFNNSLYSNILKSLCRDKRLKLIESQQEKKNRKIMKQMSHPNLSGDMMRNFVNYLNS